MLDITERKEAENRLARGRAALPHCSSSSSPLLIYVQEIDPATGGSVTTYLSPANEALIGYTAEEVQADPALWTRLIHPDDRDRVRAADRDTNVSGHDFSLEYRMLHRDGRTVWVQDDATLIESEDRRYWQGFMLDITERKEAEDKARARARPSNARRRSGSGPLDEMKNTFLQAVSHDLRTPLAAILGLAITLERGDIESRVARRSTSSRRRIAANARKLDRLVTDLLDLDRLARGIVEPKLHPTDVERARRAGASPRTDLAAAASP